MRWDETPTTLAGALYGIVRLLCLLVAYLATVLVIGTVILGLIGSN